MNTIDVKMYLKSFEPGFAIRRATIIIETNKTID